MEIAKSTAHFIPNLESWLGFNFWDGVHHKDPKQCKC